MTTHLLRLVLPLVAMAYVASSSHANPTSAQSNAPPTVPGVSEQLLIRAIEEAVITAGRAREWDLQLVTPRLRSDVLTRITLPFRVTVTPWGVEPPTEALVWVESGAGGAAARVPIQLPLKAHERVWVAQADVAAGQGLSQESFRMELRPAASAQRRIAQLQDLRLGMEAVSGIRAGDVVYQVQVRSLPSVRKSQTAWVALKSGRVLVERQARVEQDGWPGQRVRVQFAGANYVNAAAINHAGQLEFAP